MLLLLWHHSHKIIHGHIRIALLTHSHRLLSLNQCIITDQPLTRVVPLQLQVPKAVVGTTTSPSVGLVNICSYSLDQSSLPRSAGGAEAEVLLGNSGAQQSLPLLNLNLAVPTGKFTKFSSNLLVGSYISNMLRLLMVFFVMDC